mgnify:CR=1 FL=1
MADRSNKALNEAIERMICIWDAQYMARLSRICMKMTQITKVYVM